MKLLRRWRGVVSASIHCGAPKTGTTLVQRALSRTRGKITRKGTLLLIRRDLESLADRSLRRWRRGELSVAELGPLWRELSKLVSESGARRVIISHEDLLGSINSMRCGVFYPEAAEAMEALVDAVGARRTRVVYRVRRQDDYLESTYLQSIRGGASDTFDEYLAGFETLTLSWAELLERLESVAGVDGVVARYFEEIREGAETYVRRAFRDLNTLTRPRFEFDVDARNRSYSEVALEMARVSNPMLRVGDRQQLRAFLDENFSNRTHPRPVLFSDAQRAELLVSLADDNRRLHRLVASDLDESPYLPE